MFSLIVVMLTKLGMLDDNYMNLGIILLAVFIAAFAGAFITYNAVEESTNPGLVLLATAFLIFISVILIKAESVMYSTALDVYRGNTELEITSVNGVPTDTVVVFKKTGD